MVHTSFKFDLISNVKQVTVLTNTYYVQGRARYCFVLITNISKTKTYETSFDIFRLKERVI